MVKICLLVSEHIVKSLNKFPDVTILVHGTPKPLTIYHGLLTLKASPVHRTKVGPSIFDDELEMSTPCSRQLRKKEISPSAFPKRHIEQNMVLE